MPIDRKLIEILACPVSTGKLVYYKEKDELVSLSEHLAYPIRDNIPVMLETEARKLSLEEVESIRKGL